MDRGSLKRPPDKTGRPEEFTKKIRQLLPERATPLDLRKLAQDCFNRYGSEEKATMISELLANKDIFPDKGNKSIKQIFETLNNNPYTDSFIWSTIENLIANQPGKYMGQVEKVANFIINKYQPSESALVVRRELVNKELVDGKSDGRKDEKKNRLEQQTKEMIGEITIYTEQDTLLNLRKKVEGYLDKSDPTRRRTIIQKLLDNKFIFPDSNKDQNHLMPLIKSLGENHGSYSEGANWSIIGNLVALEEKYKNQVEKAMNFIIMEYQTPAGLVERAKSRLTSGNNEETLRNLLANQSIFSADNNNQSILHYLIRSLNEGNTNETSKNQIWSSIENLMASKGNEKLEEQADKTREALYFIIDASLVSDPSKISTNNESMSLNQGSLDKSLVQNPRDPASMKALDVLAIVASDILQQEQMQNAARQVENQLDWQYDMPDVTKGASIKKQKNPEQLEKENKIRKKIKDALNDTSLWDGLYKVAPKIKSVVEEIRGVLEKLSEEMEGSGEGTKWSKLKAEYSGYDLAIRSDIVTLIFPIKKRSFPSKRRSSDSERANLGDDANSLSITPTEMASNSEDLDLGVVRKKVMDVFHGRNKVKRVSN